jgi:hypothetical protein
MTLARDGSEWSPSRPGCFTIGIHWTGVWAVSRAGFNVLDKRKTTSPGNQTPNPHLSSQQPVTDTILVNSKHNQRRINATLMVTCALCPHTHAEH